MIGWLRGKVIEKRPPHLILDVAGVGYEVEATLNTFYHLPAGDAVVTLYTHLVVRDDAHLLYGFASGAERDLFRTLIKVNGVGPRLALAVLSGMSGDALLRAVADGDAAALARLPGIGKKTAERLVMELKDRVADLPAAGKTTGRADDPVEDAVAALVTLGYKPPEASRMVRTIDTDGLPSEEIIRRALQATAKK